MIIEQIFELSGVGLPGRICTSTTGSFHDKTLISKESFRLEVKYMHEAMYFTSPYLGQITHKI